MPEAFVAEGGALHKRMVDVTTVAEQFDGGLDFSQLPGAVKSMIAFTNRASVPGKINEIFFAASAVCVVTGTTNRAKERSYAESDMFQTVAEVASAFSGEIESKMFKVATSWRMMTVADVSCRVELIRMNLRFRRAPLVMMMN